MRAINTQDFHDIIFLKDFIQLLTILKCLSILQPCFDFATWKTPDFKFSPSANEQKAGVFTRQNNNEILSYRQAFEFAQTKNRLSGTLRLSCQTPPGLSTTSHPLDPFEAVVGILILHH